MNTHIQFLCSFNNLFILLGEYYNVITKSNLFAIKACVSYAVTRNVCNLRRSYDSYVSKVEVSVHVHYIIAADKRIKLFLKTPHKLRLVQ